MTYVLRPEDQRLVEAALRLGDWILAQKPSRKERKAVEKLQAALRDLNAAPTNLIAEFGIEARYGIDEDNGLYRSWRVGLSPAGLEIFSVYSPDRKIEFEEKIAHELDFWLRPGVGPSDHDGFYVAEWLEEVRYPDRIRAEATLFSIIATME